VAAAKSAGITTAPGSDLLETLTHGIDALAKGIEKLDHAVNHAADGEPYDHAKHARGAIFPALNTLREAADHLETVVGDDYWPLPTYREMLFIK
jgi:glutamine synthetase